MMYSCMGFGLVIVAYCCLIQQALAVTVLTAQGCEENYAWLACPAGKAIHVTNAHYGRTSTDVCVHEKGTKTDCVQTAAASTAATNKVKAVCDNRQTCSVYAGNHIYGDTCSDTYKYITVNYTCGAKECKNAYDDAQCDDYATGSWAKEKGNECLNNPAWMYPNCWKACTKCKADCQNVYLDDAQCDRWAMAGQCTSNANWMYANCPRACKSCPSSAVCENVAGDVTCQGMAEKGECDANEAHTELWMDRNCAKACGVCHRDCYDIYWNATQCGVWAVNGECKKNPTWMYAHCTKSCGACPAKGACKTTMMGKEYVGKVHVTKNGRTCQRWDAQSPHNHTRNNTNNFPEVLLSEANNYCRNPDGVPNGPWCYTIDPNQRWEYCNVPSCGNMTEVCANVDGDAACDAKRSEGKCHIEPETMLANCKKSCLCFKGDECLNSYYAGWTCDYWAKNGECAKNAGWMIPNCKKSCNKCS